jgi:hypothetical protein
MDASGLFVHPPTYGSRDVQYVLDWAERRGKTSLDSVERLEDMVKRIYETEDPAKRRKYSQRLWQYARKVRSDIERARRRREEQEDEEVGPTSDASSTVEKTQGQQTDALQAGIPGLGLAGNAIEGAYADVLEERLGRVTPATYNYGRTIGQLTGTVEPYPANTDRMLDREDAWALYRGKPQKNGTFRKSRFTPSQADDGDASGEYYEYAHPENRKVVRNLAQRFLYGWEDGRRVTDESEMEGTLLIENDSTATAVDAITYEGEGGQPIAGTQYAEDQKAGRPIRTGTMGQFQLEKGEDERGPYVSYYDKWDLGAGGAAIPDEAGEPFEIYGRLYYDPETQELLPPEEQPGR